MTMSPGADFTSADPIQFSGRSLWRMGFCFLQADALDLHLFRFSFR